MWLPNQSIGLRRTTGTSIQAAPTNVFPLGLFDFLCDWFEFPWCGKPEETCYYDRTDTSCWGVVQMCKNRGYTATGKSCSGGWYACGACLGFPW